MKANCQIADSNELARLVACHIANEMGKEIIYKGDSCYLSKDGNFHFVYMDETGTFGAHRTFTAKELAYINNMPLCEIICIDNSDFDDLAILFYKEI